MKYLMSSFPSCIVALTSIPTVIEVSTYYATIEFSHADGPADSYLAEYALTTLSEYSEGSYVNVVDGQERYRIKQPSLIPGRSYFIRIVPRVRIGSINYRGVVSESVQVSIRKPG